MIIQDIEVTCKILEGEEEDKYLAKAMEEMIASKNKYNKSKRGGKKGKRLFQNVIIIDHQICYNDALPC